MAHFRYMFAVLASLGMAIIYGLKVNLSVVIVVMLNHTALSPDLSKQDIEFIVNQTKKDKDICFQPTEEDLLGNSSREVGLIICTPKLANCIAKKLRKR